mmetsp:Transcript_39804/g.89145  ORF Transcript_39804/g.89145 Transcript_39804/m.89145 type:complete len:314 (+) Transcript_39804:563-1504(+)
MQESEPLADLARDVLDDGQRHALVVVSLDEAQEVGAEHLEDHAHVLPVRALVDERILEGAAVAVLTFRVALACPTCRARGWARLGVVLDAPQQLDLVQRRLRVVLRRLLNLEGQKLGPSVFGVLGLPRVCLEVVHHPHRREVAPPELLPHPVPPAVHLVDRHRVVAPDSIAIGALVIHIRVILVAPCRPPAAAAVVVKILFHLRPPRGPLVIFGAVFVTLPVVVLRIALAPAVHVVFVAAIGEVRVPLATPWGRFLDRRIGRNIRHCCGQSRGLLVLLFSHPSPTIYKDMVPLVLCGWGSAASTLPCPQESVE